MTPPSPFGAYVLIEWRLKLWTRSFIQCLTAWLPLLIQVIANYDTKLLFHFHINVCFISQGLLIVNFYLCNQNFKCFQYIQMIFVLLLIFVSIEASNHMIWCLNICLDITYSLKAIKYIKSYYTIWLLHNNWIFFRIIANAKKLCLFDCFNFWQILC